MREMGYHRNIFFFFCLEKDGCFRVVRVPVFHLDQKKEEKEKSINYKL